MFFITKMLLFDTKGRKDERPLSLDCWRKDIWFTLKLAIKILDSNDVDYESD